MKQPLRVAIIGGGTGIYPVVTALRELQTQCSSIINASDSGGSTGRIRDEFGFPPVGDLRQSLAAMADPTSQQWLQKLLLYRFSKGDGLIGHSLGNLLLTALQDMTGSTTEALAIAAQVLRIHGRVIPVTESNVQLEVSYADGTVLLGEHLLDDKAGPKQKVTGMRLVPEALINPVAAEAIKTADYIIIGPGDFYASLHSVLQVKGIKEAMRKSKAKCIYFVNLMTRSTQTLDMTAAQHVEGIEAAIGKRLDTIIINSQNFPPALLSTYAQQDERPVADDLQNDSRVVRTPLLAQSKATQAANDQVERSLLRHDKQKVLGCLRQILQ